MKAYYYLKLNSIVSIKKYDTLEDAEYDALRVANGSPGTTVEILQCVGITSTRKASTFWMDGVVPPHVCCMNQDMNHTCFICGKKAK